MYTLDDFFTADEVADILDIGIVSARELLDGVIPFETEELVELASYKGITLKSLLLHEV